MATLFLRVSNRETFNLGIYKPAAARYKIQQDKNFPVSPAKVWKVAKHVLVNQVQHQ